MATAPVGQGHGNACLYASFSGIAAICGRRRQCRFRERRYVKFGTFRFQSAVPADRNPHSSIEERKLSLLCYSRRWSIKVADVVQPEGAILPQDDPPTAPFSERSGAGPSTAREKCHHSLGQYYSSWIPLMSNYPNDYDWCLLTPLIGTLSTELKFERNPKQS